MGLGGVAAGKYLSDGDDIGANGTLRSALQLSDLLINLVWQDRGAFLGSSGAEDHAVKAVQIAADVVLDLGEEVTAMNALVLCCDGSQVGIGAVEQNIHESVFVGAGSAEGLFEEMGVVGKRATNQSQQSRLKVTMGLALNIFGEVAHKALVVVLLKLRHAPWVSVLFTRKGFDQGCFVATHALHGFADSFHLGVCIDSWRAGFLG